MCSGTFALRHLNTKDGRKAQRGINGIFHITNIRREQEFLGNDVLKRMSKQS